MKKDFIAHLAPPNAPWDSGYASGYGLRLSKIADDVFVEHVPGPWLAVYMLRRFGWPNIGSDPHKDLCSWMLTTPIEGLYLVVTPYLGGSNLHFAVRFTKEVGSEVDGDPGRESLKRRREAAVRQWWEATGSDLYVIGEGKPEDEPNELVHKGTEKDGVVLGLWTRLPSEERQAFGDAADPMLLWWLTEFIAAKHPEVNLPTTLTEEEQAQRHTPFQAEAEAAIKQTMWDLLRPTSVRDVEFGAFGRKRTRGEPAEPWEGAGNTPQYWFGAERPATDG